MPRERANERSCDKAIRDTLAYRAVFKYPLSYYQLYNTLLTKKAFTKDFFDRELNKMVKRGYIGYRNSKYFDKRVKPISWETRYKNSKVALENIHFAVRLLRSIPWIKMLAVTGSVAAFNCDRESDIDIFVVAQTHRLWLTRGFVAATLKLLGIYIKKDSDPGKICPNLFIDEEALEWPEKERSVFTAHEIVLMQPLIDRDHTYFKFLNANGWIKRYFANFNYEYNLRTKKKSRFDGSRLVNVLEKLSAWLQIKYMQKKRTTETVSRHVIHFKKNDNTNWILSEFDKLVK